MQTLWIVVLGLWAIASLARIIQFTFTPAGANDLYVYWYAGHFVREAQDPYDAFLKEKKPALPIHYLDKTVTDLHDVVVQGWAPAPALTFPMIAVLSCLAFLSWPLAKLIWLGLSLLVIITIPLIIMRVFPMERPWERWAWATLILVFAGLTSTRYAGSSGQVTFLVFILALGSIHLSSNRPYTAGIFLGLALSKYSLSIGFFLYLLLFERNLKTTLTALGVQMLGIAVLSMLGGTAVVDIIREYLFMTLYHSKMEGIHIASLFPSKPWGVQIGMLITLAVFLPLMLWHSHFKEYFPRKPLPPMVRQHLLTVLSLWALLVAYHRAYDVVIYILFISIGLQLHQSPERWAITGWKRNSLLIFIAVTTILFMLPAGSITREFLPGGIGNAWIQISVKMTTLFLGAALAFTIFLLFHLRDEHALTLTQSQE